VDSRLFLRRWEPCWLVSERHSSDSSDSREVLSLLALRQLAVDMLSVGSVGRKAAAAAAYPSLFVWLSHSRRSKAMRDAMFLKPMLVPARAINIL